MIPDHHRVRRDIIDRSGTITVRHDSRLHHIGLGRQLAGTHVLILADDLDVRVITRDGHLIPALTLDPNRDYQPTGRPPGPPKQPQKRE